MNLIKRLFESSEAKATRLAAEAEQKAVESAQRAVEEGSVGNVEELVASHPRIVDNQSNPLKLSLLHRACYSGQLAIVHVLVSHRSDVNSRDVKGETPLHVAAFNANSEIAELLLTHKADVDALNGFGMTPLNMMLVRMSGLDKESLKNPLGVESFVRKSRATMAVLIKSGADVNYGPKWKPLALVRQIPDYKGCARIIEELLQSNGATET